MVEVIQVLQEGLYSPSDLLLQAWGLFGFIMLGESNPAPHPHARQVLHHWVISAASVRVFQSKIISHIYHDYPSVHVWFVSG